MGTACRTNGENKNAYMTLAGKLKGKRPIRRERCKWVDNIREIGWGGVDRINLAQDGDRWRALVKTIMNLRDP
jgi:hypothetical protein